MAFHYILDAYPTTVSIQGKVYKINSDFKTITGIICLETDDAFSQNEKLMNSLYLFYGNSIPENIEEAYYTMWNFVYFNQKEETSAIKHNNSGVVAFDFTKDSDLVYTAFYKEYGLDLSIVKLHWFKFICLLNNMDDQIKLNEVIRCRSIVINDDMNESQKKYFRHMKETYSLNKRKDRLPDIIPMNKKGG